MFVNFRKADVQNSAETFLLKNQYMKNTRVHTLSSNDTAGKKVLNLDFEMCE